MNLMDRLEELSRRISLPKYILINTTEFDKFETFMNISMKERYNDIPIVHSDYPDSIMFNGIPIRPSNTIDNNDIHIVYDVEED